MLQPFARTAPAGRYLALFWCVLGTAGCGEDAIRLGIAEQPSSTGLAVDGIVLRQAKTAALISDLSTDASISIGSLASNQVSLEAIVTGAVVSVEFVVDGKVQVQEVPPFTYPGDTNGQLQSFNAVVGAHSVTATPYSESGAEGQRGSSLMRSFTFTE